MGRSGIAAAAAAAAARGPGALGSFGGGEGGAGRTVRRAPGKGHVPGQQRQQVQGPPPPPPRPLPRENGCGAGRAAKFCFRAAGCGLLWGSGPPSSAARPRRWSPRQDLERLGGQVPLRAVQKVEAGAGRRRWPPLCGSPPLPHTVRAASPPPLRPSAAPCPCAGRPRLSRLQLKATAPAPSGEEALLLPDMVQSGGRRAMAP